MRRNRVGDAMWLWVATLCVLLPSACALVVERPCCSVMDHIPALFGANVSNHVDFVRREIVKVEPFDACTGDIQNDLSGKMALIRRGECNFAWKVLQAQKANAIAVVVMDFQPRTPHELWEVQMIGDGSASEIRIPSVFVSHESGNAILEGLEDQVVLVTMNTTGHRTSLQRRHHTVLEGVVLYALSTSVMFLVLSGACFAFSNAASWYQRTERTRAAKRLPVMAYKTKGEDDDSMCAICLEPFEKQVLVKVLPCRHEFHHTCIDPWLEKQSSQCPLCKQDALCLGGSHKLPSPLFSHLPATSSPFQMLMYTCMVLPIVMLAIVLGILF